MNELIYKAMMGKTITNKDIENALHDICDNVHSSCGCDCPVWLLQTEAERKIGKCPHCRNGESMRIFIANRKGIYQS
jgi:hypothetical protein